MAFSFVVAIAYLVLIATKLIGGARRRLAAIQLAALLLALAVLRSQTGFPDSALVPFGAAFGLGVGWTILLMGACLVLGMIANYVYFLSTFSWREFLRPLCISPLLLVPLIGATGDSDQIGLVRAVSLCLVSFQSGFFWRSVFTRPEWQHANPSAADSRTVE